MVLPGKRGNVWNLQTFLDFLPGEVREEISCDVVSPITLMCASENSRLRNNRFEDVLHHEETWLFQHHSHPLR